MENRNLILYIAMSLDGYIAAPDDNLDFLSAVESPGEDYGYGAFIETVDTVILGRRTYDKVLSFGIPFPHAERQTFVITRQSRPAEGNVRFYSGDIRYLVTKLKSEQGKNIFCDGGAQVVNELLKHKLIDEFYISIIPVLLGEGTPLFEAGRPQEDLKLVSVKSFEKGLVQLHYIRS